VARSVTALDGGLAEIKFAYSVYLNQFSKSTDQPRSNYNGRLELDQLYYKIVKLSKAKSSKAKFPGKPGIIFAAKHVLAPHWERGCFIGVPETTPTPTLRADATRPRMGQGCALGAEDARTAVTGVDGV